jgi:hypothetical protein
MGKFKDLTGQKFSRLTVVKRVDDEIRFYNNRKCSYTMYLCKCDCGNEKIIRSNDLRSNKTKSCGCIQKEETYKSRKKYNTYDLSGEYGIGYTSKGEEFYFDLEDYDEIKDYCWHKNSDGYFVNINRLKTIKTTWLHKLIMNADEDEMVDHADRNPSDNRKKNLRKCTTNDNVRNQTISERNTSGVIGVYKDKERGRWYARVTIDYKPINLGYYISKEDAIKARLLGELKYYEEFAPQKHLFKKYNININKKGQN